MSAMVPRIILLKLHDGATREAVAKRAASALADLPQVTSLIVGLPADAPSEKSWDVSIVLGFATLEILEFALASEAFKTHFENELAAQCQVIKSWSFSRLPV